MTATVQVTQQVTEQRDQVVQVDGEVAGEVDSGVAGRGLVRVPRNLWLRRLEGAGELSGTTLAVLRALGTCMDADGASFTSSRRSPSAERIARAARLSPRAVKSHLARADAAGWLQRRRSKGGCDRLGRGYTSRYLAAVPAGHPLAAEWAGASWGELTRGRRDPRPTSPPPPSCCARGNCAPGAHDCSKGSALGEPVPPTPSGPPPAPRHPARPTGVCRQRHHQAATRRQPGAALAAAQALIDALPAAEAARAAADTAGVAALASDVAAALAAGWTAAELARLVVIVHPLRWPAPHAQHPTRLLRTRLAGIAADHAPAAQLRHRERAAARAADRERAAQADADRDRLARNAERRAWHDKLTHDQRDALVARLADVDPDAARRPHTAIARLYALAHDAHTSDHTGHPAAAAQPPAPPHATIATQPAPRSPQTSRAAQRAAQPVSAPPASCSAPAGVPEVVYQRYQRACAALAAGHPLDAGDLFAHTLVTRELHAAHDDPPA